MASKKKWKQRAKEQRRIANVHFQSAADRAAELARIDVMLMQAEFPGPTIEAYVAQVQHFLQRLVEERGVQKKSGLVDPNVMPTEAFISDRPSSFSPSIQTPDGEYSFLEEATSG